MTIPLIFDTDPGNDDAAAIAILLTNDDFEVRLITSVAGNVSVDKTTNNVLKLTHYFNRPDVKVARGAEKPLVKPFKDASNIHGKSGMPGYEFGELSTRTISKKAVDAIHETLNSYDDQTTLVAVGAFTNIANLIQKYPQDLQKIERLIVMGGSLTGGNLTSVAEFNVFTDPDAAKIVFESDLDITMIGLDVTEKALLTKKSMSELLQMNETGKMLMGLFGHYQDGSNAGGKPMHDVNTLYYLLHPEKYKLEDLWVDVVTDGPAIGATVADILHSTHSQTNVHVAKDIDGPAFNAWYLLQIFGISDGNINAGRLEN